MMNKIIRRLGVVFLIAMCLASLSVTAYAYADDAGPEYILETTTPVTAPTEPAEEPTTGSIPLTPDGNMTLVDDIEGESTEDKQFITVVSKNGNYFYIIIDRAGDGENTVHFLNQVDEADLLALMEEGQAEVIPIVCSCTEKCQAGAVNTACKLCMTNMGECVGKEAEPVKPIMPEEPATQTNTGAILAVVLILAASGGAAYYFLVRKPKQAKHVPSDLDDFDLEDEEEYLTEREE